MQAMMIEARRAPARAMSLFPLWCKGSKRRPRHQAKATIPVQQDQDQRDGRKEVIVRAFDRRGPALVRICVLDVPLQNGQLLAHFPLIIWGEAQGLYK